MLGLARSGFSAAKLLHDLGALVTVNDGKPFAENPKHKIFGVRGQSDHWQPPNRIIGRLFVSCEKSRNPLFTAPCSKALEKNSCNHGSGASVSNL